MAHPLETILKDAVGGLKELAGADTIIGTPVPAGDGTLILPVSRISMGFLSGGGEYGKKDTVVESGYLLDGARPYPFSSAVTAGVCAVPVAFIAVQGGEVRVLPASQDEPLSRVLAALPGLMGELRDMIAGLRSDAK